MLHHQKPRRSAAIVLECALIMPAFLLLLIGLIVAGVGVFRYQQLASLAREGTRYAAVHGYRYQLSTNKTAATEKDVYEQAILPKAVALDPGQMKCTVTWSPDNFQGSQVTVELQYQWIPEAFLGGITLSSTSTMIVSY